MTSDADSGQRPRAMQADAQHLEHRPAPPAEQHAAAPQALDVVHAKGGDDRGVRRESSSDEGQHQQAGPGAQVADWRHREREVSIGKWKRRAYRITDQWAAQARASSDGRPPCYTLETPARYASNPEIPGSLSVAKLNPLREWFSDHETVLSFCLQVCGAAGDVRRGDVLGRVRLGSPRRHRRTDPHRRIEHGLSHHLGGRRRLQEREPGGEGRGRLLGHRQRLRALLQG